MRTAMKKRVGERIKVKGTFERFGTKRGFRGPLETILLKDIEDEHGELLSDHVWFTRGRSWPVLKRGDTVSLVARIEEYERGYNGRRDDVLSATSLDYKLTRPTKIAVQN